MVTTDVNYGMDDMIAVLTSFTLAFLLSFLTTPLFEALAHRKRFYASHNLRTIHEKMVPNIGGLAIVLAFSVAVFMSDLQLSAYVVLAISAIFISAVGLYDDIRQLGCYMKLVFQTLAALLAVWGGFSIESASLPLGLDAELGIWSIPVSVCWIVFMTNAINLLDGVDGLATALCMTIAAFAAVICAVAGEMELATICAIFIGGLGGFLKYNFPPARIFMGDTGSLFLGFVLACLSLKVFSTSDGGTDITALVALFLIPISDTLLAIGRRIYHKRSPFLADSQHLHHCLLRGGRSQISVVRVMTASAFVSGMTCLAILFMTSPYRLVLFGLLIISGVFFLVKARYFHLIDNEYRPLSSRATLKGRTRKRITVNKPVTTSRILMTERISEVEAAEE